MAQHRILHGLFAVCPTARVDRLTDQTSEGDVDHEYCARVTLAYLAHLDAKENARSKP